MHPNPGTGRWPRVTAKPDGGSGVGRGGGVEALFSASSSLPSARAGTTKSPALGGHRARVRPRRPRISSSASTPASEFLAIPTPSPTLLFSLLLYSCRAPALLVPGQGPSRWRQESNQPKWCPQSWVEGLEARAGPERGWEGAPLGGAGRKAVASPVPRFNVSLLPSSLTLIHTLNPLSK